MSYNIKVGLFAFLVWVTIMAGVAGIVFSVSNDGVDDVSEVESKAKYSVVVDDVEFLCLYAPGVGEQVILHNCDGTQAKRVAIKNYDSITVTPIERAK